MKHFSRLLLIFVLISSIAYGTPPRLTVVFVVDQFAHHYLQKISPHVTGGLKTLLTQGIVYQDAQFPYNNTSTAPGHTTINTGTTPRYHGIIGNSLITDDNQKIEVEQFNISAANAVLSQKGVYPYSMAPDNIMVDGLSDQFMLHSQPESKHQVFALSHKSRAAIGLAGKLGKAIWIDSAAQRFTSSKAYFDQLPAWVEAFNPTIVKNMTNNKTWHILYPKNPHAYNYSDIKNYSFTSYSFSLIDTPFSELVKKVPADDREELYLKTPQANEDLLGLARACLDANLTANSHFLLWVSLSPLDMLGHLYGPYSQECIDMLYHLDQQLGNFMNYVQTKVKPNETLYVLTADHGVMPIIEILQHKGMKNIYRIQQKDLLSKLNAHLKEKHNIANCIARYMNSNFYVNKKVYYGLAKDQQLQINASVKTFLEKIPGIERVWTFKELEHLPTELGSIDSLFQNQLYKGRTGEFICKTNPYTSITKYPFGTDHYNPYEYNTHVPLVIYQKGVFEKHTVEQRVYMTQLAPSLAKICEVARPSASRAKILKFI